MTNSTRFSERILDAVTNASARKHSLLLLAIIALGFLLRLYSLVAGQGYREFAIGDELAAYQLALELLAGVDYAWYIGQPNFSGGQVPGPLWTLFWLLSYKLGASSLDGAMFFMLLLGGLAVLLAEVRDDSIRSAASPMASTARSCKRSSNAASSTSSTRNASSCVSAPRGRRTSARTSTV